MAPHALSQSCGSETKPNAAWEALLKEVLKGDSKKIWHGEHMENLTADERRLVLPIMKNYISRSIRLPEISKSPRYEC